MNNNTPVFNFNPLYFDKKAKKPLILSTHHRYVDIWGGRARGASHAASDSILLGMMTEPYFRCYIMRQVFNDIRGSIWKDVIDRLDEAFANCPELINKYFAINEHEMILTYKPNNNQIIAKGFKKQSGGQTAKLKSLAGATHVVIEEADEISRIDFEKLDNSIRTKKNPNVKIIRLFNSPNKGHWIMKDWYILEPNTIYEKYFKEFPELEGYYNAYPVDRKDFLSIFATYLNNYTNIVDSLHEKINKYKESPKDSFQFEIYLTEFLGLVSSGAKGRVYKKYTLFKDYPQDVEFYRLFGQDWGGNKPNALIQIDVDKKTGNIYLKQCMYRADISHADMIATVKTVNPQNHEVVCDNARDDMIREYQTAGINAFGIKKGLIIDDIGIVKQYNIFVHKDSKDLIEELDKYCWVYDEINNEPLNKPIDDFDHLLDALKYAMKYYHLNFGI